MKLNALYLTFQGEVNISGIGKPVVFLRLQGCHLRCYKRTMGILCDTPEGLEKSKDKDDVYSIVNKTLTMCNKHNVNLVTLTGGDPLWNREKDVKLLLSLLSSQGIQVSVETSGTLSWLPYSMLPNVSWVLDYKLRSAGLKKPAELFQDQNHLNALTKEDIIKFIIYDKEDLKEAQKQAFRLRNLTKAQLSMGAFWGGKLNTFDIFNHLKDNSMLGFCTINMQTHKMAVSSKYDTEIPEKI